MKCWTTAAASACIAWTAAAAIAQQAPAPAPAEPVESVLLEETVVTPRRSIMEVFDEPYMIDVVDQQEITDRLYRTVPEALRFTPGVMVQKTSHGQGSPFIRGFTGFRTLMLIDGIRLNIAVDDDGNVYVTGAFTRSIIIFGNDTLTNSGNFHFFITKFDSSGNVQ